MTALLILWAVITLILASLLVAAAMKIEKMFARLETQELYEARQAVEEARNDHEHAIGYVWRNVERNTLRLAAKDWDSAENMKVVERLRREWQPGQPGVVAQWLRDRAEQ